jgi:molecular chaperone DnaK (HSP70)
MLSGIRIAPRGIPQIEVEFAVDADGLLTVKAGDRESGVSERIVIPRITRNGSDKSRGSGHLRRLIGELQGLKARRGALIDRELKEDIDDILAISAESLEKQDEERIRECIIALDTLASEVKALDHAREANRAG